MPRFCQRVADSARFQGAVLVVIAFAAILVGIETYPELVSKYGALFAVLDLLLLLLFTLELAIRIIAFWPRPLLFFRDPWNVFDFVTVAIFYTPFVGSEAALLRLARVIRMFRLLRAVPGLQRVVLALVHSVPSLGYIGLLLFMLIYVYAVAGSILFAETDPEHFGNLGVAMKTMVQVVTFDDWAAIMNAQPDPLVATLYFIPFILIGTMVVLNLFIGVIIEGFDHARTRVVIETDPSAPPSDGRQTSMEADLARISEDLDSLKRDVDRLLLASQEQVRR